MPARVLLFVCSHVWLPEARLCIMMSEDIGGCSQSSDKLPVCFVCVTSIKGEVFTYRGKDVDKCCSKDVRSHDRSLSPEERKEAPLCMCFMIVLV